MDPIQVRRQLADLHGRMQGLFKPEMSETDTREFDRLSEEARGFEEQLQRSEADEARQARIAALQLRLGNGQGEPAPDLPHQTPAGRRHGGYSLLRAIRLRAEGRLLDGVEGDTSDAIAERSGSSPAGFFVPQDLRMGRSLRAERAGATAAELRALDTTTGAQSIPTILDGTIIDYLRAAPLMARLGARMMMDMQGIFAITKQTAMSNTYWVSEATDVTESTPALAGKIEFKPSTIGAYSVITRAFTKQTSVDAEDFVRIDFARNVALGIDRAGFMGTGTGAEPEGLLAKAGVQVVALGTNGAAPSWAKVVEMESLVAAADALDIGPAYVTTPRGRGKLKTTEKATGHPIYLWNEVSNELNGYAAHATNQVPSNLPKGSGTNLSAMIFGQFTHCIYAFWGGLDFIVNPYKHDKSGSVAVTVHQDADFDVRYPEAFSRIVDMVTT